MTEPLTYTVLNTALGWIAVMASGKGLVATTLPQRSEEHALMALGRRIEDARQDRAAFEGLAQRLKTYFEGGRVEFADRLDLSSGTSFQRKVWETTRIIGYGETRSYLWIAKHMRRPRAARAVGQALGANPLPIIVPCHRVMASDGGLGGFSGGLGVKRMLLRLEGSLVRPGVPAGERIADRHGNSIKPL
jgi:methylated-DNA-[protein]-cysteine S-methyltransferase